MVKDRTRQGRSGISGGPGDDRLSSSPVTHRPRRTPAARAPIVVVAPAASQVRGPESLRSSATCGRAVAGVPFSLARSLHGEPSAFLASHAARCVACQGGAPTRCRPRSSASAPSRSCRPSRASPVRRTRELQGVSWARHAPGGEHRVVTKSGVVLSELRYIPRCGRRGRP
jgi:hypothetical protein